MAGCIRDSEDANPQFQLLTKKAKTYPVFFCRKKQLRVFQPLLPLPLPPPLKTQDFCLSKGYFHPPDPHPLKYFSGTHLYTWVQFLKPNYLLNPVLKNKQGLNLAGLKCFCIHGTILNLSENKGLVENPWG